MHKSVLFFLQIVFLLFINNSLQAQVYKCENSIGEVRFSDEVCKKGENTRHLNWLSSDAEPVQKKLIKKAHIDVAKNNEPYALLSLLTSTQLELQTASLRSSYQNESTDAPELILPDGVIVDLLKVDKIILTHQYTNIKAHFIMANGYEETKILESPYPIIKGNTKIGRFSKSLKDIKKIEFFNAKKIPPKQPIIDLDLSEPVQVQPKVIVPQIKSKAIKKPVKTKKHTSFPIQVKLRNKKTFYLKKTPLTSSKGKQNSHGQYFIINDTIQIPFNTIKQIKIRPMTTNHALLVAIELLNKEIKMEVMLLPYTRIMGQDRAGQFDHLLSDIESISF